MLILVFGMFSWGGAIIIHNTLAVSEDITYHVVGMVCQNVASLNNPLLYSKTFQPM